ncbi:protein ARV 1-like isoform X2 [Salvia hispanica]|uniref:protein ARV 1-like isoform X2 n=1 Tax=Salvia hispanica TaxID=49212 RepID=UPI0020091B38|nr:protein ARV 1-like isoform X2 [Salvia hispanica]
MAGRVTTSEEERTTTDFRCVQCGFPVKTLYIQYSPGNIRLVKCGNCKAVADGYIECEVMILILDLILHKPKAYRHVFYNMFSKETVKFEMLTGVMFGNLIFICVLFCGTRKLLSPATIFHGWKQMLFVVVVSSYFKIFLLAMMVWEFPSSVIVIIDVFVLSSNTVALKVITNSVMRRSLLVCALAHGLKCFTSQSKAFGL